MTERIDGVIVVGAGPVGLVTALKLARANIPVLVLDAELEIIRSPRAIVYHSPTLEALDNMGLLDDLKAVGIVKQDYQFRTPDGTILAAPNMSALRPEDTAYPYNLHLAQHELAGVILRHFEKTPGSEVRWNTRVTGIEQDTTGVTVTVETANGPSQLRCDWLIGADGGRSTIRRAAGLSFDGHTHPERFVSTNVYYDFEARGFARANFYIDPVHWAVIVKINKNGLWRVTYGEDSNLPEDGVRDRVADHYKHLLPDDGHFELKAVGPFRVHERCAETFRAGRVLMAGDAAHVCNPLGGLGLTSGLLDAVSLGDALSDVANGTASEDLLDRYAVERRRVFQDVTGPAAAENKRRLSETNPDRKRTDLERLQRLRDDPAFVREVLTFTYKLVGNPVMPRASA